MTLMADDLGLQQIEENPLTGSGLKSQIIVPAPPSFFDATGVNHMMYKRSTCASIKVEDDCCAMMGNWVLDTNASIAQIRANKRRGMTLG